MATTIGFSPVYGPLAAVHPLNGYRAEAGNPIFPGPGTSPGGKLSVTLQKGEVFKGSWQSVSPVAAVSGQPAQDSTSSAAVAAAGSSTPAATSAPSASTADLAADWDRVYGPGYFKGHVLTARLHARAHLISSSGATAVVEVYTDHPQCGDTPGVARDSDGNVYQVTAYRLCPDLPVGAYGRTGISDSPVSAPAGEGPGPRLVLPATGGPPVLAIPLGGGIYLPVTGGIPTPGTPISP
jgi:hypothetical protein